MKSKLFKKTESKAEKGSLSNVFLLLLAASYCVLALMIHSEYRCDALVLSIIPCFATVLILFSGRKKPELERSENAFIMLFSLLGMAMLSFVDIVNFTVCKLTQAAALRVAIGVYFFAAVYFCTCFVLKFIYKLFLKERTLKPTEKKKPYVFYVIIIAFVTTLFLIAAGYGYDGYDTLTVYAYFKEKGIWFDWHTISYEMLMALCLTLMPNAPFVFPLIVVQCIMWTAVTAYAMKTLYEVFASEKVLKVYTLLSLIIFAPIYYAPMGIKDTVFSMFMYAFCISIFNVLRKANPTKKDYILLAVNASLASLFRHAAVEVVAVSLLILLLYRAFKYKNKQEIKRYIAIMITPVIVFVGVTVGIGDGVLHKYNNPKFVKYTLPIYYSVSCADKLGNDFGDENKAVLERIMPLEDWIEAYKEDRYWADTVTRDWGGIGEGVYKFDDEFYKGIIKVIASLVTHHPLTYLESMFDMTSIVWRVGNPNDCNAFYPSGEEVKEYELYRPSVAGEIIDSYIEFSVENTLLCSILWRGGFWILTAIFASFVLIKKKRAEWLFMILPVVIFAATLFVSIPAQDPRYVLSFVEVGMFYALVAFYTE